MAPLAGSDNINLYSVIPASSVYPNEVQEPGRLMPFDGLGNDMIDNATFRSFRNVYGYPVKYKDGDPLEKI